MVDATEGKFPSNDAVRDWVGGEGVCRYGVVCDRGSRFELRQQVKIVLEPGSRDFNVISGVTEVGEDDRVVAFLVVGVDAIIEDTSVFLDGDFVAEPVSEGTIALVFGDVEGIDPEIVIFGLVVGEFTRGVVDVVFEREVEPLRHLSAELEIEMLFLVV